MDSVMPLMPGTASQLLRGQGVVQGKSDNHTNTKPQREANMATKPAKSVIQCRIYYNKWQCTKLSLKNNINHNGAVERHYMINRNDLKDNN